MEFIPVLSAMRRNKVGALLIAAQMAVTLAFLTNALTLIEQRREWSSRPTGIDEADIFVMRTQTTDGSTDFAARQAADLAALRSLPGVVDAYASNDHPMKGGGWAEAVALVPDQKQPTALAAYYFADDHALRTLDLKLIAGRNFTASEIAIRTESEAPPPIGYILSKSLAIRLFPDGDALGKSIYVESATVPAPIIGIVARLQTPFTGSTGPLTASAENSVMVPYRMAGDFSEYLVRAAPDRLDVTMKAAEKTLYALDRDRILKTDSMRQVRADAYRGEAGLIALLTAVCIALLAVTAMGIVGLTSYWVAQRRRQIGIRRALGATRSAIMQYFQTENLLISAAGVCVGAALAIALNVWMVNHFEMIRLSNGFTLAGAAIILILGQFSVLWPALRAASVPPALATRGE
jgi:putative ABC transport system permease protein